MKTSSLIDMLSANVETVDRRQVPRTIATAGALGAVVAIVAVLAALGGRAGLADAHAISFLAGKLVFTLALVVFALIFLGRYARPGGERRAPFGLIALPFVAVVALGLLSLLAAPRAHWQAMLVGDQWLECLLSIPVIAIVPFALVMWAVRRAAPTHLTRAGALAGLVAGSISATAYALHCVDDSVPFVALWYGGTIAFCTVAGAALGPRLLRW
ncbi:DUF1109 domain-containing protein [Vineibacter terrae]|uniref:DUF1109 domain-containing protein n=1 Tax=Vineibacter terrae TaxID=2586908 RepID=A0A5C8PTZ5_9HYPH|nr:DUF1109 domain-containing protein [Vineibacter terrae]TXL80387.1 DUF1109 domain-containing protein [Vineibacter terrae]